MKKRTLILLSFSLFLIAGCIHTNSSAKEKIKDIEQSVEKLEKTAKDSTLILPALGSNIDSLKNKLQENTKQNNSTEARLQLIEDDLGKVKELENKVNQICNGIDKNINYGINITVLIVTVLTVIVSIIGIFVLGYLKIKLQEFKTEIKESLAIARNINAVNLFNKNNFEEAIKEGSAALKCAIEAYGKCPTDEIKTTFLSVLKSNLAYYWVAGNKVPNREIALQYAEEGLKTGKIAFVDNFLYTFMKLAKTKKEKDSWQEIYLAYKTDIENYYSPSTPKTLSIPELQQYKEFYTVIERESS